MKLKPLVVSIVLVFVCSLVFALLLPLGAGAATSGTTTITIIKHKSDGTDVQTTITWEEMQAYFSVQGDNITHYYHQGPTFDDDNLWDENETVNLKDKGVLLGTDLRDLCDQVGGMTTGDVVKVSAIDGFNKSFEYENVYNTSARQGKIVVSWYCDGYGYVPSWSDGMMLVCFSQTSNGGGLHVFGNWDMHESFPEDRWHYFETYPSSNGYTVKNIDTVEIFAGGVVDDGGEITGEAEVIDVTAYVDIPSVGISLSRESIDYGSIRPGASSSIIPVTVSNVGDVNVLVSLEVLGDDDVAQDFYEQSLYIDEISYKLMGPFAQIDTGNSYDVDTQLKVPDDWDEEGSQDALFIFWAETSE